MLKVEHPEGADFTFLSRTPFAIHADGVVFEGCAGAVRVSRSGTVTLALASGSGRVGYKGTVLVGTGPFEKTFAPGQLIPGETQLVTPASTVTAPPVTAPPVAASAQDGFAEVTPGVQRASANGVMELRVQAPAAGGRVVTDVEHTDLGNIHLEATRAVVRTDGKTVRFTVPDTGYVRLSVGNVGVRGLGPFSLTFEGDKITGTVNGATRTLVTTVPANITLPMYRMDGNRWFAGWADDHSIVKGTATPQLGIGFGVTAGQHTIEISEWTYPALPPAVARLTLSP